MKLIEKEEFKDFYLLVKFVNSENVEDLLNGDLYMNPLITFIKQEEREKIRGQGDKYEAAHVVGTTNVKLYDYENDELLGFAKNATLIERYPKLEEVPVFCFTIFTSEDFDILEETEEYISFKLNLCNEEKFNFLNKFGNTAVILPDEFPNRIIKSIDAQEDFGLVGKVKYDNYSKGINILRKDDFDNGRLDSVLWKDIFFNYQREMRFTLGTKLTKEPIKYKIGSIRNQCTLVETSKFFNSYGIRINFKKEY